MSSMEKNTTQLTRRSRSQLFQSDTGYNVLADRIIDEDLHNSRNFVQPRSRISSLSICAPKIINKMHKSTKTGLIGLAILLCVAIVVLLLNLESVKTNHGECVQLDGVETCHSTVSLPYRYYGTKTAYHIALQNNSNYSMKVKDCNPKIFYFLSRHATRYPDEDNINLMINILPQLQEKILNSSLAGRVKLCNEDLKRLKAWTENLLPEYDNKISPTGKIETIELAQRFKERFPSIFNQDYSPEKFIFEYTSRERTRSTAELFAKGLFNDSYKDVDFEDKTNDKVLQFHKDCKQMQKDCKDKTLDLSEIDKFENGPLMQKVVESISERVGFVLTKEEIKIMYKACAFGYALDLDDAWCSLFSQSELKVLEFGDDIDDYYKDAYGNKLNHEQACPVAQYIINLFREINDTSSKAVLQFSHAGGVKKIFSLFGLFQDEKPLLADNFCSQQQRKWRSSLVAPFTTNLAMILFQCGNGYKVQALHNEKIIKLAGCDTELCPIEDFYKKYSPIAEECDIKKLCCKCCLYN